MEDGLPLGSGVSRLHSRDSVESFGRLVVPVATWRVKEIVRTCPEAGELM
jgi:hypothetical protein